MLKIIGAAIIIAASTAAGFIYAISFDERVKRIRSLECALNTLESEIIYSRNSLSGALSEAAKSGTGFASELFLYTSEIIDSKRAIALEEVFREAWAKTLGNAAKEDEEFEVICSFIKQLDTSDTESLKKNFNVTIKRLEGLEKIAESIKNSKSKVYRYMGFSIGMFIVIILS